MTRAVVARTALVLCAFALSTWLGVPVAAQAQPKAEPLAEVNGKPITATEVEAALGATLAKLEEQIYSLKRQKIGDLIGERLLAQEASKRGVSVQKLLDAEVTAKVTLVTEQEIEEFYQTNKARLQGTEATAREQVRAYLQNQKLAARRAALIEALRSEAKVVVHLPAPPVSRAEIRGESDPFRGSATASVTIVEFSDFHCPFCKRVQPTLAEILSRYGDKVKLIYRDFPIDGLHPQARKAAEAAQCANDQGKFWPYHDRLFASEPDGSPEKLKAFAREVGLDLPAFESCLAGGKHQSRVQEDIAEGARHGVTGTPAFFVNGRLLSGAQPLENFIRVIDEELSQKR